MVYSSIPVYLDPGNWQQVNSQSGVNSIPITGSSQLTSLHVGSGPTSSNIRPASMSERARLANIPMPETALKCPRCESTNTKFCYFNNYNLTQPRHFCKTCRRYWTRGGALRSVPVGGGCRRNKRSKSSSSSSSKSRATSGTTTTGTGVATTLGCASSSTSTTSCGPIAGSAANLLGLGTQIQPIRIMGPPSQFGEFNPGDIGFHYATGINSATNHDMINNFPFGGSYGVEPWRFQHCQFSSMAGLEGQGTEVFPFQGGRNNNMQHLDYGSDINRAMPKLSISGITPLGMKMEDNLHEMNLSRQFLGFHGNDHPHHYSNANWASGGASTGTCSWTDLSGFSSSSANSNPM